MKLIVAADKNWAIGKNGQLLVRISNDMKNFRQLTEGNVVVMGRKTLESFPNGLPLAMRTNIVLTRKPDYQVKGALIFRSVEDVLEELKKYDSEDIYVIGGEEIYREFLPYCDVAHVTKIDHEYLADAFFPNLDQEKDWVITADSEEQTYFDLEYTFLRYERRAKN